jgi:MoxR-like ATPase
MNEKFSPQPAEWQESEQLVNLAEKAERKKLAAEGELRQMALAAKERKALGEVFDDSEISEIAQELEGQKEAAEAEIKMLIGPQEQALVNLRTDNLWDALEEEYKFELEKKHLIAKRDALLEAMAEEREQGKPVRGKSAVLRKVEASLDSLLENREKRLESSPEAYFGLHLRELMKYKRELASGKIVETPYVQEQAEDIVSHLGGGQPVLIYGHLGSGKTELAMHIARNHILKDRSESEKEAWSVENPKASKKEKNTAFNEIDAKNGALVISGSKYTSLAELYGHQVLAIDKVKKEETDAYAREVEEKFNAWVQKNIGKLKPLSDEEREAEKARAHDRILQTYLTSFKGGTVTDFFLGPIYKAMEEGRPVIIDEVNAIPHEVLISLNHILTRKVGDVINVQQDSGKQVTVKKGFGIMMTGNLNQGSETYVDRQDMDPAFLSRLYKLEYDYLPQDTEGSLEDSAGAENELFQLLVAKVMDRNGNIEIPAGALQQLWKLAKAARITQDVFAGKEVNSAYYFQEAGGRSIKYLLKESVMSMRALGAVISQWQKDGYGRELDYYLWKEFISQSTIASDRAYLYQLMKDQFGFFKSAGWPDQPDYGAGGVVSSFIVKAPRNKVEKMDFLGPRETVKAAFGQAPERAQWPDLEVAGSSEESPEVFMVLEEFKDEIEKEIERLAAEVASSCPV